MKLKEVIKPELDSAQSRTQVCPMPKLTLCYHCNKFPLSKVNKKRTQLYKSWTTRSRRGTRKDFLWSRFRMGFPCGTAGREPACNVGDLGLIPGLGRSPGEGKGYPLQYSGHYTAHGVAESWTQLSLSSLFGTQGSVFFFATVLYCIHCRKVRFCYRIVLYTLSPGGGIVPWSHEPINKLCFFP